MIEKIFKGRELTIFENSAILNKWSINRNQIEIPIKTALFLISNDILTLDSGNWETGEKHYVYNDSLFGREILIVNREVLDDLKSVIRELKLNYLCQ